LADEHFSRLRAWGLTFLRLSITWEAVEHAGSGRYDTDYLDYFYATVRKAGEHGLDFFIDPHQDAWDRLSGGDSAPGGHAAVQECGRGPSNHRLLRVAFEEPSMVFVLLQGPKIGHTGRELARRTLMLYNGDAPVFVIVPDQKRDTGQPAVRDQATDLPSVPCWRLIQAMVPPRTVQAGLSSSLQYLTREQSLDQVPFFLIPATQPPFSLFPAHRMWGGQQP
jgi:hypothetical protein